MEFPEKLEKLKKLVGTFRQNLAQYKATSYKEARTRTDFIDKFFKLLDWDISNEEGVIEQYRDVVREDTVEIGGNQKAPDYSFRIGSQVVFFVEAKKPSVNIKDAPDPAFQLRRYAYTARLPVSILTDFEELAVYDTRIKPGKNDKPSFARIFYCNFEEYEKNFEFIFNTFSKNAVRKGSLNQYIEGEGKKGTSEVDKEFLKMIESWRNELAKTVALKNRSLDIEKLNYAVQKIIDRIIFLRIAEAKQVEYYGALQKISQNENKIFQHLKDYFGQANKKYNSELFKNEDLLENLKVDDEVLKDIITSLYPPECPYEFSVLPVEILGNVYEQFLGKVIQLTAGHQAKVEEKPEVRKAGGVYYTPQYIVDYIVKNTVGEKIKNKKPKEIENLKILDPACGSGSFLIGAFKYLLDYHLIYYARKENLTKALKDEKIYQIKENSYQLTIKEKQRILLNNIYGVDIDGQAVEVTKLSLLLKLMEGENQESSGQLFKHSDLKLLPNLAGNIKCGNSLIGSDFYRNKNLSLFGSDEMKKINAFDWDKEFPEIMRAGGFDCVIGNPPYVKARDYNDDKKFYRDYLNYGGNYLTLYKMWDLFIPFIEKGINLLRKNGLFGMIVPDTIEKADYASLLRKWLLKNFYIYQVDFFPKSRIFVSQNKIIGIKSTLIFVKKAKIKGQTKRFFHDENYLTINRQDLSEHDEKLFSQISLNISFDRVNTISLGDICFASYGLRLNSDKEDKNSFKKSDLLSEKKTKIHKRKFTEGKNIDRYCIKKYLWVEWDTERCPKLLVRPTFPELYELDKLLLGRQTKVAAFDNEKYIVDNTIIVCIPHVKLKNINNGNIKKYFSNVLKSRYELEKISLDYNLLFILGILNSKIIKYYINFLIQGGIDMFPDDWKKLPIPKIDFSNSIDKSKHDKIAGLVDQMLSAQKKFHSCAENDKKSWQKKIEILDQQIDELVYELYGLTKEEIEIVEGV